jgi:hypothetical protein
MAKRSKAYVDLLAELTTEYRNAPVVEVNETYRDTFDRAGERFSVELCHGIWRTFFHGRDCMPGSHANREAAKSYALSMLGIATFA